MYHDEDLLMLSGIQHFAFCRRQWALIHVEGQWQENLRTTLGHIVHVKAHDGTQTESRGDTIITRGLRVTSYKMGVTGQCDVVEFHRAVRGAVLEKHDGCCEIPEGALFYAEIHRRVTVTMTAELRQSVRDMFTEMHRYLQEGRTPRVKPHKHCNACSLKPICLPGNYKQQDVGAYYCAALGGED